MTTPPPTMILEKTQGGWSALTEDGWSVTAPTLKEAQAFFAEHLAQLESQASKERQVALQG